MPKQSIPAYARLNARIMPNVRGERFEEPLNDALAANGYGAVKGGGTMMAKNREIDYCGIDIDLYKFEKGILFVRDFLAECGAPKGSMLQYTDGDERIEVPFGRFEGLAIYLNGTELPQEVYAATSAQIVYDEISRLLGERGRILGHWQGPTETALYLYGPTVAEMRTLINDFLGSYPLCEKARFEVIAK
jgi:hypothetical protein